VEIPEGEEFFEDLYRTYFVGVYRFFLGLGVDRAHAEDLAQETYVRIYTHMDKFRGEAKWAYLEQTARRLAYNHMRDQHAQKREATEVPLDDDANDLRYSIADPQNVADEVIQRQAVRDLHAAVEKLPPGMRACLELYLQGFGYDYIAKHLGLSVVAVKSRLRDARRLLRSELSAEYGPRGGSNDQL